MEMTKKDMVRTCFFCTKLSRRLIIRSFIPPAATSSGDNFRELRSTVMVITKEYRNRKVKRSVPDSLHFFSPKNLLKIQSQSLADLIDIAVAKEDILFNIMFNKRPKLPR